MRACVCVCVCVWLGREGGCKYQCVRACTRMCMHAYEFVNFCVLVRSMCSELPFCTHTCNPLQPMPCTLVMRFIIDY